MRALCLALTAATNSVTAEAAARLRFSNVFQNGMVLQRGIPIKVWGFGASEAERLTVELGTEERVEVSAKAAAGSGAGHWTATLNTPAAALTGTSLRLILREADVKSPVQALEDVVLGDVYLFSGQSNTDLPEAYVNQFDPLGQRQEERAADELGKTGLVRLMTVPARCGLTYEDTKDAEEMAEMPDCLPCPSPFGPQEPLNKCNAKGGATASPFNYSYCGCDSLHWRRVTGPFLRGFSAVAWFTGRALATANAVQGVPIGLIRSSWGATSIASWSSPDATDRCPQKGLPVHSFAPHFKNQLWANMIAPLVGLHFAAVIWVHGARNVGGHTPYMGAEYYSCALPALIRDWREKLGQAELPFLVVEMPVYCNSQDFATWHTWCNEKHSRLTTPDTHVAEMRAAQNKAQELSRVFVVSTIDQGSLAHSIGGSIHSIRKPELGQRLATAVLSSVYKEKCAVWSGPTALRAWRPYPGWVEICFDTKGGGGLVLNTSMSCPKEVLPVYCTGGGFEVQVGSVWMPPFSAKLSDNGVLLEAEITSGPPHRVRYAWADWPVPMLSNDAGLPAKGFDLEIAEQGSDCPPHPAADEECHFPRSVIPNQGPPPMVKVEEKPREAQVEHERDAMQDDAEPDNRRNGGASALFFAAAQVAGSTARHIDTEAERRPGVVTASLLLNGFGAVCALVWCYFRRGVRHKTNCGADDSTRTMEILDATSVLPEGPMSDVNVPIDLEESHHEVRSFAASKEHEGSQSPMSRTSSKSGFGLPVPLQATLKQLRGRSDSSVKSSPSPRRENTKDSEGAPLMDSARSSPPSHKGDPHKSDADLLS